MSRRPVLFILPQTDASANGGIASISQIISRLRNHRPIIVTNRSSAQVERWRGEGIETHLIPATRTLRHPAATVRTYWRYARELRRLIASSGATLVHANNPFALQLALGAVKLSPGAKVALNLRDTMDPERRPSRARFRFLFGAADHIFFLSQDMANRWAAIAPYAKRSYSVTYSIVDPDRFAPLPPYQGDGPQVVLLSGIIRPKKGQLEFIRRVSPRLAANGIATWLAGDFDPGASAYERACSEAAAPLGDMVRFLGYRDDVPELMQRSAVVAVASRHEGLVRSMIEAMSCARPVVSFDVCSARELLEDQAGGAGIVVRSGDHEAMAEAILGYCRDPAAAALAGEKSHAAACRLFQPGTVVNRYEGVYEMLAARE